jgi:hypothetical protein
MLVLAGFSFFYTFMRKYAYSAISHTFLITVLAAQWYVALSRSLSPSASSACATQLTRAHWRDQDHSAPDLLGER